MSLKPALALTTLIAVGLGFAGPAQASSDSQTPRPELSMAKVWWTTAAGQATLSNPAGTTLEYSFLGYSGGPPVDPGDFIAYTADGTPHEGDAVVAVDDDTVAVRFADLATQRRAAAITLAAVRSGAVTNDSGLANTEFAVPVSRWLTRRITRPQGIHLLRVRMRAVRRRRTVVRFVFTGAYQPSWVHHHGFHLQLVGGRSPAGIRHWVHTTAHRTFYDVAFRGHFPRRRIARGTVLAGAIGWETYNEFMQISFTDRSSLQAAAVSRQGRTSRPDLVRVQLQPSADPRRPAHAVFVFDQRVVHPRARRFLLGGLRGRHAVVRRHHPRQVRVTYVDGSHRDPTWWADDAAVRPGAVRRSQADQVNIVNDIYHYKWGTSDGRTAGPDLVHDWSHGRANLRMDHQSPDLTVAFEFDEADIDEPQPGLFHLYLDDGTESDASSCTVMQPERTADVVEVRCTFTGLSPDQAAAATLGTVDAGAVHDALERVNPIGAGFDAGPLTSGTNP